jgi:hypothetical protein
MVLVIFGLVPFVLVPFVLVPFVLVPFVLVPFVLVPFVLFSIKPRSCSMRGGSNDVARGKKARREPKLFLSKSTYSHWAWPNLQRNATYEVALSCFPLGKCISRKLQ